MSLEPPELVALRRALGQRLAAARHAAEIGQQQLARKAGYSRSSVAHAEAGRQLLSRAFWRTADTLLKADGALLTGYEQVQAAVADHELQRREAALAEAYAAAQAQRATASLTIPCPDPAQHANDGLAVPTGQDALASAVTTAGTAVGVALAETLAGPLVYFLSSAAQSVSAERRGQLNEQLGQFLHEWAKTMERRELLRLLGWTAAGVVASPIVGNLNLNTDEQERVAGAIASPSRVDAQVIDHIETMLQHCKRQDDVLGPQAVLETVLGQRKLVCSLLEECPAELRSRLLSVYSSMSSSVGTYCFDLDDAVSATRYCDQAREAAQEARNTELAIYALCNASYFASWHGKTHIAIDSAVAAQRLAAKTDDVLLQACAAERLASAYGFDGQYKESMNEFDRALAGLARPAGQRSPKSPAYYFDEGVVASKQSHCLLRLGKPAEAAASAERGLQLFDNSFTHGLAYCTLSLGTARLRSGEVEEAARVIGEGALLAARIRSTRLTGEVRVARWRLEPWQDTQAVKVLDERLREMGLPCIGE